MISKKIVIIICFIAVIVSGTIAAVKEPNVAGSFYPSSKKELYSMVTAFLKKASAAKDKRTPWAIIAPHAGYIYSGQTAAFSYAQLQDKKIDTVFLLAPSHFVPFDGAAVYPEGSFKTPLGEIIIDEKIAKSILKNSKLIKDFKPAFEQEHSLEVHLPFLQSTLTSFRIIPIVMGSVSYETSAAIAEKILPFVKNENVLVVASTDLSHYKSAQENDALDRTAMEYLKNNNVKGLLNSVARRECELCGIGPVSVVMILANSIESEIKILKHSNSGEVSGDYSAVVGYLSAAYYRKTKEDKKMDIDFAFNENEKKELLQFARDTIAATLQGKKSEAFKPTNKAFQQLGAAFVTLHKEGRLRGCIGHIRAHKPLIETVSEMAKAAAFEDPRFSPLQADEIDQIEIEISVLTPLKEISNISEIEVGKHGLFITSGINSGLLLPQVATEQGWNREEFLEGVCQKAGLPSKAWQEGATIYIFSAEVFSEKD